jgi:hypothetical protein
MERAIIRNSLNNCHYDKVPCLGNYADFFFPYSFLFFVNPVAFFYDSGTSGHSDNISFFNSCGILLDENINILLLLQQME